MRRPVVVLVGLAAAVTAVGGIAVPSASAGTARPAVLALTATPASLPAAGGTVVLSATARHATRCTFTGQRAPGSTATQKRTVSCSSGRARVAMKVAANALEQVGTVHFSVVAIAGSRSARAATRVIEAARVPPPPLEITDEGPPPVAVIGVAYSLSLAVTGGTGGYGWTVASGTLPTGLALSPSGTISGTPASVGTSAVTLQVADSSKVSAQWPLTFIVAGAAPPTLPVGESMSKNWSGFAASGGPFTAVSGTFNVPTIATGASTDTETSEWVGIDGVSDATVLQAGVDELYQQSSGQVLVRAWWETYPNPAQFATLQVAVGDQVTIAIGEQPEGNWLIEIDDKTNGQRFQTSQSYFGQLTSAEWIVEAPSVGPDEQISTLGQYSPNVTFTGLGLSGTGTGVEEIAMVQGAGQVSTPSPLSPAGFTVAFGGGTPPPPG